MTPAAQPVEGAWLQRLVSGPVRRVAVLTVLGLVVIFRIATDAVSVSTRTWGYDFSAYFLAAQRLAHGLALYSPEQLAGPFPPQVQFAYLYPPFLAVALLPFNLFADFRSAMWIWAAIQLIAMVGATILVARRRGLTSIVIFLIVLAEIALPQVAFELAMGNVHLILVALFLVAWLGIEQDDRKGALIAGIAIGIATLIKIFPGVMILWLLATRRFYTAVAAVGSMAVLAALTVPFVGIGPWFDYIRVLANLGPPVDTWSSVSLTSLLSDATGFTLARVAVTAIGIVVVLWAARARRAPISYAIAVSVSALIVPAIYPASLALAVAPLLLYALYSADALGPLIAYAVLFVGGQLALFDLRLVLNWLAATLSMLASLVVMVLTTTPRSATAPPVPNVSSSSATTT